jgi:hypothetical protein
MEGLQPQVEQFFRKFLASPQTGMAQFTTPLQQQQSDFFNQFFGAARGAQQTGTSQGIIDDILAGGEGMLSAMEPLFQRNLEQTLRMNREFGGPSRFNTAVGDAGVELSQRALQDYNLFQQQALEQARGRQLQAVMGIGGLAGQSSAQQQALLQQILGGAMSAGGAFRFRSALGGAATGAGAGALAGGPIGAGIGGGIGLLGGLFG